MPDPQYTWASWLQKLQALELLQLPPSVAKQEWKPEDADRAAAWELYTELRTRITAQPLQYMHGDEETALTSVADLFKMSREIIRKAGPKARHFSTLTTFALNRVVRPFTAKWHKGKCEGKLANEDVRHEFRTELIALQRKLRAFTTVLGSLAEGDKFVAGSESWPGQAEEDANKPAATIGGDIPFDIAFDEYVTKEVAEKIGQLEHYEIRRRRQPDLPAHEKQSAAEVHRICAEKRLSNVAGLAISGGGIRSATFALGVVQRLTEAGVARHFDFLSTVSGGGYVGSFLSTYLNTDSSEVALESDKLPFRVPDVGESEPLRHLRGHSKYLMDGGLLNRLTMILLGVYGVVASLLVFWPLLAGFLLAVGYYHGEMIERLVHGQSSIRAYLQSKPVLYPALLGIAAPLLTLAPIGLLCRRFREERALFVWQRFVACVIAVGVVATGWQLIPPLLAGLEPLYHRKLGNWLSSLTAISGAIAALQRFWATFDGGPKSPKLKQLISYFVMVLAGPAFVVLLFLLLSHKLIVNPDVYWGISSQQILTYLTFGPLAFVLLFLDINQSSLHPFYRRKLSEAYLIRHMDSSKSAGEVCHDDGIRLSDLRKKNPRAPYHLINCALNAPSSDNQAVRGRGTDFFFFSQGYSGSACTGYYETTKWERKDSRLNLGTAMATSAAAASPFMGVASLPGGNFLLTLFNVRLDYWLAMPGRSHFLGLLRAGPWYLVRQAFGWMDETTRYVDASDGGHIENLALYELLRRRCKFIVAIDGECDPDIRCGSLMQLIRYALIDFGITITIDMGRFNKTADGTVPFHFALATIKYPELNCDSPAATGYLLYVKLSCTGNEPPHVRYYQSKHAEFPHEPTSDQFFDEDQFEAYRALGEHAAGDLFSEELLGAQTKPVSLDAWFQSLAQALRDPNNN